MHGRNTEGLIATANSFCKLDFQKYQGGSFQVELHPSYFAEDTGRGKFVVNFSNYFFTKGGVQINLNVLDLEKMKEAMEHPEREESKEIVVKVTGYSAHFVLMDKRFQEEFIERVNYDSLD